MIDRHNGTKFVKLISSKYIVISENYQLASFHAWKSFTVPWKMINLKTIIFRNSKIANFNQKLANICDKILKTILLRLNKMQSPIIKH